MEKRITMAETRIMSPNDTKHVVWAFGESFYIFLLVFRYYIYANRSLQANTTYYNTLRRWILTCWHNKKEKRGTGQGWEKGCKKGLKRSRYVLLLLLLTS